MPRTKVNPDELLILELRITPPDGNPIEDWQVSDQNFKMCLAAKEGGTENVRLHYHAYVECKRSRTWLIKWIYSIARAPDGVKGNTVFFSGKPHANTLGYVVKHGDIVVRHGCSETFVDEWLAKSAQYQKDRAASKKRQQRVEKSFTQQVRSKVVERLVGAPELRTPSQVLPLILQYYHEADKVYPNRSAIENLIVSVLHPYDPQLVAAFYLRSFEYRS